MWLKLDLKDFTSGSLSNHVKTVPSSGYLGTIVGKVAVDVGHEVNDVLVCWSELLEAQLPMELLLLLKLPAPRMWRDLKDHPYFAALVFSGQPGLTRTKSCCLKWAAVFGWSPHRGWRWRVWIGSNCWPSPGSGDWKCGNNQECFDFIWIKSACYNLLHMWETLLDEEGGRPSTQPQILGKTGFNALLQLLHLLLKQTQLMSRQHLCSPENTNRINKVWVECRIDV